jgi:hypothetical protein
MSSTILIRWSPLTRMASVNSRWRADRSVSPSRPAKPITAFIGVRISWLIAARKSAFAWAVVSASSRAAWASRRVRSSRWLDRSSCWAQRRRRSDIARWVWTLATSSLAENGLIR